MVQYHSYLLTIIGNNVTWNYSGIIHWGNQNSQIREIGKSMLNASLSSANLVISNTNADWAQDVTIEIIGLLN